MTSSSKRQKLSSSSSPAAAEAVVAAAVPEQVSDDHHNNHNTQQQQQQQRNDPPDVLALSSFDETEYFSSFPDKPGGTQKVWNEALAAARRIEKNCRSARVNHTGSADVSRRILGSIDNLKSASRRLALDLPFYDTRLITPKTLDSQILDFQDLILDPLQHMHERISDIGARLKSHATLSNRTELRSIGSATHDEMVESKVSEEQYAEMMQGVHIPSPTKDQVEVQNFLASDETIQPWWETKSPPEAGVLEEFAKKWNELVRHSSKSDNKKDVEKGAQKVAAKIVRWNQDDGVSSACGRLCGDKFVFPSDTALEKEGVEPILAAVLFSLSQIDCKEKSHKDGSTLMKEVKNVRGKYRSAAIVHQEGSKQVVGRLAKRALVSFDVADIGIDSSSVGVIVTPVYLQVIRLQVQKMGTADVAMQIQRTRLFPLVDENAFNEFVRNEEDKNYLHPLLYPPTKANAAVSNPPNAETEGTGSASFQGPDGIRYLWELLHSTDHDLGTLFLDEKSGATYFDHGKTEDGRVAEKLLGSGSQGFVYAVKGQSDVVVKSSIVGELRYVKRELKALRTLRSNNQPGSIPLLSGVGCLEYSIRQSVVRVPALLISPRGIPASNYLMRMSQEQKRLALLSLWANGLEALDFAHKKKVFHLDVCPRNFVWHESGNRFVLIDWGCANCEGDQVRGFRGSLPFAHAEVHTKGNQDIWSPSKKHDRASLIFTVCALHLNNLVPWEGFKTRLQKSDLAWNLNARRESTLDNVLSLIRQYKEDRTPKTMLYGIDAKDDRFSKLKSHVVAEVKDA